MPPSLLPSMNLVSQLLHHELNSSVAVGSSGRSKCNLLVLLSRVTLADIQQPNPPQDTWQLSLQLRIKSQGTGNGLDGKIHAQVHDVVSRSNSVVSAPYSTARGFRLVRLQTVCARRNTPSRLCFVQPRTASQARFRMWTCACVTGNLLCQLIRGGAIGTVARRNAALYT